MSVIVLPAEASSQHNDRCPDRDSVMTTAQAITERWGVGQDKAPTVTVLEGQVLWRNTCRGIVAPSDHEAAAQHNHHL